MGKRLAPIRNTAAFPFLSTYNASVINKVLKIFFVLILNQFELVLKVGGLFQFTRTRREEYHVQGTNMSIHGHE